MDSSVFKNSKFLFILVTAFLSVMGIGVIIPVIPFIVGKIIGAGKVNEIALYVGLLVSTYSFFQFFAAPVLGALSDKYGRRPVLLFCQLGSAIGYIIFGLAGSLWMLFLGRIIDGTTGGDISTIFAYIADITKPQDRGKYYGIVGATVGFGFMLGPTIGGILSNISLSAPLFFAAGLTILNMIFGFFILPESHAKEARNADFSMHHLNPFTQFGFVAKNKLLTSLLIVGFFYFLPFAQLQVLGSVYFKDILAWGPTNIGFFFLLLGIGDMFTQGYLNGKLSAQYGPLKLVFAGFVATAAAYGINALLPLFPQNAFAYLFIVIYALGSGLFEPSFGGLISQAANPGEQGRVMGVSQSVQSITRIIGPLLAAFLYQFGHSTPFVLAVILSIVGIIILDQHKEEIHKHI
ncbi:MAG TPA: MFS transporter [Patescibacteria group bacterium]|nr:MFS transporter [Patescibacteria group bacterium]